MIEKYYLFSLLNPEEAALIEKRLFLKAHEAGTMIFEEGEAADAFFIIQKGEVEIFRYIREKPAQTVMTFKNGDFFGEVGIIDSKGRFANARAKTDLELLVLLRSDFERILGDHDEIRYKIYRSFIREMVIRLRRSDETFKSFFKEVLHREQ
ncbi:MAG TPA: cyclic nucleotide-binding domain-containing protein [Candidatus Mcinerneyibacteriales bacterium]|nr:cyclic nucleotide-binding domain-containing protein [Candidatus Mcinerneyibacteriota bacterium]HPE20990.1 cyclic nucleotide-binding domain-containing protein [Candidatus Mcinerneyibacteriales bacterium]HPJ70360.1 cyclic nucleotide-binding domain-containing protein [Candidatus Mcinerneyibacteriales bacterium]